MAKQTVLIGTVANDRTGTPLRSAMDMINDNFTELYDKVPDGTAENDFIVAAPTTFAWVKKTLAQVKTILGLGTAAYEATTAFAASSHDHTVSAITDFPSTMPPSAHTQAATTITPDAPTSASYANPLALDVTTHKDYKCSSVTGNTIVNLSNTTNGDSGLIELIIDGTGGYTITLGTMFTKNSGGGVIDTTAATDNIIAWYVSGSDIIYSISQVS